MAYNTRRTQRRVNRNGKVLRPRKHSLRVRKPAPKIRPISDFDGNGEYHFNRIDHAGGKMKWNFPYLSEMTDRQKVEMVLWLNAEFHVNRHGRGNYVVGSCIQDSFAIAQVLKDEFGMDAEPVPADMSAWNSNAIKHAKYSQEHGTAQWEEWLEEQGLTEDTVYEGEEMKLIQAKSDLVGIETMRATNASINKANPLYLQLSHKGHDDTDPDYPDRSNPRHYGKDAGGYDGHIVVRVGDWILDPTLGQIRRPPHGNQKNQNLPQIDSPLFHIYDATKLGPLSEKWEFLTRPLLAPTIMRERRYLVEGQLAPITGLMLSREYGLVQPTSAAQNQNLIEKVAPDTWVFLGLRPDIDLDEEMEIHDFADGWWSRVASQKKYLRKRIDDLRKLQEGK